jgi:hypothetical protein
MDPITQQIVLAAAGAGGDKVYVDDVFSTFLYEGTNGAWSPNVGIDFAGEGGLTWIKSRNNTFAEHHTLVDTERVPASGSNYNYIATNSTNQEQQAGISGFTSTGFTFTGGNNQYNGSLNYVSWNFRRAPGFFDVCTWNGQNNNGTYDTWITIPHNLGSTPGMVMLKSTSNQEDWLVWHRSLPTQNATMPSNSGFSSSNYSTYFGHSSGFADANNIYVRAGQFATGYQGYTYVAYIFAHDDAQYGTGGDESIIKCGSFTATNTWGNFKVDLGFEPQFVMMKRSNGTGDWIILDSMRGITGPGDYPLSDTSTFFSALNPSDDAELLANDSAQEGLAGRASLYSQGFLGSTGSSGGNEYIYMAIRRPHKPPEAATEVFAIDTYTGSIPNYISGFPVDFVIKRDGINSGGDFSVATRLQGRKFLKTNSTEAEGNAFVAAAFDHSNAFASGTGSSPDSESFAWMFKRAPGFMDVVAYTANNNTAFNVNHNLGVAPELVIIKNRDTAYNWLVGSDALTAWGNYALRLNTSGGENTSSNFFTAAPTSTQFKLGTSSNGNYGTDKFIAYLFATLPGISKVGSYSGNTSNAIDVNCGFIAGARFVLIKRTDTEIGGTPGTSWFLWDSVRGIVSGNDPYLLLNRDNNGTDAQVTNTDYIDPLTTGFTVSASAPAALNATGGTYLYLAIA